MNQLIRKNESKDQFLQVNMKMKCQESLKNTYCSLQINSEISMKEQAEDKVFFPPEIQDGANMAGCYLLLNLGRGSLGVPHVCI